VDDHARPIAELRRLYEDVHGYYFGETKEALPLDAKRAAEVRALLARAGFGRGPRAGGWDEASQQALEDFMGWENLEGRIRRDGTIDALVLAHLRKVAAATRAAKR
jgi:uncharacterized Ntn-hydrolase superfamily protein